MSKTTKTFKVGGSRRNVYSCAPDIGMCIASLIDIGLADGDFLGERRDETKFIGEKLNLIGGWALMSEVHSIIQTELWDKDSRFHLQAAWNGIGDWKW